MNQGTESAVLEEDDIDIVAVCEKEIINSECW